MIEKIYDIAKVYVKDLPFEKKLSQNLGRDKYLIVINLDEKKFEDLIFSEAGVNDEKIFFYQKKGNFSLSFSPSIYLQGDDKKDKNVLKKLIEFFNHEKTKDIYEVLLSSFDAIYEKLTQIDKRERQKLAVAVVVKVDGEIIYPADHEGITEVFRSRLTEALRSSKKEVYDRCFLCGREVDSYPILNEVFKFSSFDKPGFTPVMSRNSAGISNICIDCFADLKAARNFINENLTFSFFGGGKLWIIPSGDPLGIKKVVNNITNIFSKKGRTTFANIERELEETLSDEISIHYDFVVLRISNNEEKILLHIEDVSPSRISQIHTTSKKIVNLEEFQTEKDIYDPTLKVFHNIISSGLKSERNFLELVRCIYSEGRFSKDLFLNAAISWIRKNIFSQNVKNLLSSITYSGKLAFSSYIFLSLLGVVGKGGEVVEKGSFFERYDRFFDSAWKKAVFLTGVLTGYILDFQQREKGSTPFLKKLKGLKMRKEDVEGLLPEIKSKLMQYKIENEGTNRELERASKYFLEAGDWNATVDEINFVFTIGMSMYRRFIRGEEDDDSEKQE